MYKDQMAGCSLAIRSKGIKNANQQTQEMITYVNTAYEYRRRTCI